MKKLNYYIVEAWSGVKQQANNTNIESWCDEMGIKNYTINGKGEIDVNGHVDLAGRDIKELPYKFGKINGRFNLSGCKNLTSLQNCPYYVDGSSFCVRCKSLDSLKGCPKEVNGIFDCDGCNRKFTQKEVMSLCKVKGKIFV